MKPTQAPNLFRAIFVFCLTALFSCVRDGDFTPPDSPCSQEIKANITISEVLTLYNGQTIHIQEDLILEGFVISSDQAGNFFSSLHFQDNPLNPTQGLEIELELRDSHLFYEVGKRIYIRLSGLYLGKSRGVYKLGGAFPAFGNLGVGRLPATLVEQHLLASCEPPAKVAPQPATIATLKDHQVNTLIQLDEVEVVSGELGQPFAVAGEDTERTLQDCDKKEVLLLNSGYSDFYSESVPEGKGSITAVLYMENNTPKLIIRDLSDLGLSGIRCAETGGDATTDKVFISELADPDNESGARFVELYNADDTAVNLRGWTLRRYTNGNSEISSVLDLSGFTIAGTSTLVIASDPAIFEAVYGFPPQIGAGANSPADSNGDDNLELVDGQGKVLDTFGVIGEDGSGTSHEFEDGRALRKPDISKANPVYDFSEWLITNDTGAAGTINQPQIAPGDFTPGIR